MWRILITCTALALTGCNAARTFVSRLDNVARHRCECAIEAQCGTCGHCSQNVVTPVVHHEDLPASDEAEGLESVPAVSLVDTRVEDLEQKLADAEREQEILSERKQELEELVDKHEARIVELEQERKLAAGRLQQTTDRLLSAQTQLRDVEVKFAGTQAAHEQIISHLEQRLASLVDHYDDKRNSSK